MGISLAASPLANSSRASPAMEYGGSAAARPLTHPASFTGYGACGCEKAWLCTLNGEITVLFPSSQAVGWDNMAFVFLNRYLDLSEVSHLLNSLKK